MGVRAIVTRPRPATVVSHPPELVERPTAKVSVIIPCYNYARFLPAAIDSALSQVGIGVEVIVVNDASTDNSADVARSYAARDARLTLIDHKTNTGHVVAYNDGFDVATGDYIVRLDADDVLTPGSLLRAVEVFSAFPEVGLVYGHPRHFTGEVPTHPRTRARSWTVWSGEDWLAQRCRAGVNCITTPEAMIRGTIARKIGGLDLRLAFAQDMEMWLRVATVSDVARVNGADQALHRDHESSMSVTVGAGVLRDLEERRRVFDVLFDGLGADVNGASTLHDMARAALAREALDRACRAYDRGRTATLPVDDYVAFAFAIYPLAAQLKEWRAFRRRRAIDPNLVPKLPPFVARAIMRRLRDETAHVYWRYTGT
jgi:glycosyltransferase involved in cell wall biosynthesis